jgi:hypothetical protein
MHFSNPRADSLDKQREHIPGKWFANRLQKKKIVIQSKQFHNSLRIYGLMIHHAAFSKNK